MVPFSSLNIYLIAFLQSFSSESIWVLSQEVSITCYFSYMSHFPISLC